jgi:hypothetical protein
MLKKMRREVEPLVDKAQTVEGHRFDSRVGGHKTHCRVLLSGLINDLSDAKFFKHLRDKAQMISNVTAVGCGR